MSAQIVPAPHVSSGASVGSLDSSVLTDPSNMLNYPDRGDKSAEAVTNKVVEQISNAENERRLRLQVEFDRYASRSTDLSFILMLISLLPPLFWFYFLVPRLLKNMVLSNKRRMTTMPFSLKRTKNTARLGASTIP